MSHVSLGRPEFVPGDASRASDRQIPLCDFSLSVFFSPEKTMTATDVTGFDGIFSTGFFATFSRF